MKTVHSVTTAAATKFLLLTFFGLLLKEAHTQSPPSWNQVGPMMETLGIANALVLALVCTFYSAVDFSECLAANMRYSLWDLSTGKLKNLTFATSAPPSGSEEWTCSSNPCFESRPIDADGTMVSGNYAKWWFITRQHPEVTDTEILANQEKYIGDFGTPVDEFNSLCMTSCCFLCAALMLAIMTLSTGSTNVFTREQDHYYGHQYRVVMKSYMYWVRWAISLTIVCTIIGFALYFQIMKTLVFMKYPDNHIEQYGRYPAFGTSGMSSTYGWCATAQIWMMYLPTLLGIGFLSMGTRAAYCYPYASAVDQSTTVADVKDREKQVTTLYEFLRDVCELKTGGRPSTENGQKDDADVGFFEGVIKGKKNVFLQGAGGQPSEEAEAVASALFDAGIKNPKVLLELTRLDADRIFDVKGLQLSAALYIVRNCNFLIEDAHELEAEPDEISCGEPDYKLVDGKRLVHEKHVADRALRLYTEWLKKVEGQTEGRGSHFYAFLGKTRRDSLSELEAVIVDGRKL